MKEEKEQAVFKQHCRLAMAIIIASQTQEEALESLKETFGDNAKVDAKCYFAFNNLKKEKQKNNKE